jgi:hypothetical protein
MLTDVMQAGGFVWRGVIPWDKTESSRAPHTGYFRHQCEYIVYSLPPWAAAWPVLSRYASRRRASGTSCWANDGNAQPSGLWQTASMLCPSGPMTKAA